MTALTADQAAAVERGLLISANITMERARLRGVLTALCGFAGFSATVKAVQGELLALAENERCAGRLPEEWVG